MLPKLAADLEVLAGRNQRLTEHQQERRKLFDKALAQQTAKMAKAAQEHKRQQEQMEKAAQEQKTEIRRLHGVIAGMATRNTKELEELQHEAERDKEDMGKSIG